MALQARLYIYKKSLNGFKVYIYHINEPMEELTFQTENCALDYLCKNGYQMNLVLHDGYWFIKNNE